jgi:hypothetical protein
VKRGEVNKSADRPTESIKTGGICHALHNNSIKYIRDEGWSETEGVWWTGRDDGGEERVMTEGKRQELECEHRMRGDGDVIICFATLT